MTPSPLALIRQTPPAHDWITRPDPAGELVWWCELDLELCPTSNRTRHGPAWAAARDKERLWKVVQTQARVRRWAHAAPLPGRPMVLACRLSDKAPDVYSDWAKRPIDMLCQPRGRALRHRLGLIVDDSPSLADVRQWWEPAKRGAGRVVIEVWTGASPVA